MPLPITITGPPTHDELIRVESFAAHAAGSSHSTHTTRAVEDFSKAIRAQEAEKWKQYYADTSVDSRFELESLGVEAKELEKAIKQLDPDGNRHDWTFASVQQSVNEAKHGWENKKRLGKTQKVYHDFMVNMHAHSHLLAIIPQSNTYVSIVAGACKVLVQTSKSHRDTIEQLSKALKDINDEVEACQVDCQLVRSEGMKYAAAKFYIHVFLFYADALKWYKSRSRKKVLNSFRPDFATEFATQLAKIKELSGLVQRTARAASAAELKVVRLQGEDINDDLRAGLLGLERHRMEQLQWQKNFDHLQRQADEKMNLLADEVRQQRLAERMWLEVGFEGTNLLLENGRHIRMLTPISREVSPAITIATQADLEAMEPLALSEPDAEALGKSRDRLTWRTLLEEIEVKSAEISFVGAPIPDFEVVQLDLLDSRIVLALEDWTKASKSTLLYLEGDVTFDYPPPVSQAAAQLLKTARSIRIPAISYFCAEDAGSSSSENESTKSRRKGVAASKQGPLFGAMVSLALQILSQLPPADSLPEDATPFVGQADFSFDSALQLLKTALAHAPPLMLCMIDSFETLEVDDDQQLEAFVEAIRDAAGTQDRTLKVLFTCQNRCADLISRLDDEQIVLTDGSRKIGKLPLHMDIDD